MHNLQKNNSNKVQSLSEWSNQRFINNLAHNPYTSNVKNHCHISSKKNAFNFKYIQANNPISTSWIVIDVDNKKDSLYMHPYFYECIETPVPNIVLKSPDSGHFQLLYAIDSVFTGKNARYKPQQFLKSIKNALTASIPFADQSFSGGKVISWNPLSKYWERTDIHSGVYSLTELRESINERYFTVEKNRTKEQDDSLSAMEGERNVSVFNALRKSSYKKVYLAKEEMTHQEWIKTRIIEAKILNAQICEKPLSENEISGIARSVANYTWFKYTGKERQKKMKFKGYETTTERQKASASRTHSIVKQKTLDAITKSIEELIRKGEKTSIKNIAERSRKHRTTVSKYKKEIDEKVRLLSLSLSKKDDEIAKNKNVTYDVHQVTGTSYPLKSLVNFFDLRSLDSLNLLPVSSNGHVYFDNSYYSVPISPLTKIKAIKQGLKVFIFTKDNILICTHKISNVRNKYITDPEHFSKRFYCEGNEIIINKLSYKKERLNMVFSLSRVNFKEVK